jgi:hypothetical protein
MALLVLFQAVSSPDAWINAGAGEGVKQIGIDSEHIRGSGTFSFVVGPALFFGVVAAYLIDGYQVGGVNRILLVASALATMTASCIMGSRTALLLVALVICCGVVIAPLLYPRVGPSCIKLLAALALCAAALVATPIVREAYTVSSARVEAATEVEGGATGFTDDRVIRDFTRPFELLGSTPVLGYGLGTGTSAAKQMSSKQVYIDNPRDGDREWARVVLESGPALGLAFLLFRCALAMVLVVVALRHARRGQMLSLELLPVAGWMVLNGNLGQTTILGFGVLAAGFMLAAVHERAPVRAPGDLREGASLGPSAARREAHRAELYRRPVPSGK